MLGLERLVNVVIACGCLPKDVELFDCEEFDVSVATVQLLCHHVGEKTWQQKVKSDQKLDYTNMVSRFPKE